MEGGRDKREVMGEEGRKKERRECSGMVVGFLSDFCPVWHSISINVLS